MTQCAKQGNVFQCFSESSTENKGHMKVSLASAITFSSALLCVASPVRADTASNFVCRDGKEFTAIFESAGSVLIMIDGGGLRLEVRRAASGVWYASRYGEFRGKNDSMRFKMVGRKPTICRRVD